MELKQISDENRIIFLQKFIERVILTSSEKYTTKKAVEQEKVNQKIFGKYTSTDEAFKKIIKSPIFDELKQDLEEIEVEEKDEKKLREKQIITNQQLEKPSLEKKAFQREGIVEKKLQPTIVKDFRHQPVPKIKRIKTKGKKLAQEKSLKPLRKESPFEKIGRLLKDPTVNSIECPGPGKNLMVKRYNQVNITQNILNKDEIASVIEDFSEKARIPIVGGILKAAVGDLMISAVISEFVGSRFIINKINPYSQVE
jgi:hypothetical protein